jgi:hypothetical protein
MAQISDAVPTLERELRSVFGQRFQSLVVVGQHGHPEAQGHAHRPAPTRTMAIVETMTERDLRACAERVASWHEAGLATPLLLAAHEFEQSLDVFPLEFGAILADHAVVAGRGPFETATVEAADIRRACEVQARSHLLHLREGYLETLGNGHALAVLIVSSAAPFAALLSAVARLEGRTDGDAEAAGRHAERILGVAGGSVTDIVKLAGVPEVSVAEGERLFPPYLAAVERLVNYVDGWSDR